MPKLRLGDLSVSLGEEAQKVMNRRSKLEALVWKHTHKDFKGVCGEHSTWPKGTKTIVHYDQGTCLVKLSDLTDRQLLDKLPKAVREKFEKSEAE